MQLVDSQGEILLSIEDDGEKVLLGKFQANFCSTGVI